MERQRPIVMVSGCFDILHGGHLEFFEQAKALGKHLVVTIAGDAVLAQHKGRVAGLPLDHRLRLVAGLKPVDEVVATDAGELGGDFIRAFREIRPDILAANQDDKYADAKWNLCSEIGAQYVQLRKPENTVSTTDIRRRIASSVEVPARVDFAGGWLDVPRFARKGAFIVNCAISPVLSLNHWPYEKCAGIGGSAAYSILTGVDAIQSETRTAGWQDPAIIMEGGLCVWESGERPVLSLKTNAEWLRGLMALLYTGAQHKEPTWVSVNKARDYDAIEMAGGYAANAVRKEDLIGLGGAISWSYKAQLKEGMAPLPECSDAISMKYCGSGHGGYALYLFDKRECRDEFVKRGGMAIEPWVRSY